MVNRNNRQKRRNPRLDPILYTADNVALATADTVSNLTVYNNGQNARVLFNMRQGYLNASGGGTDSSIFCVIRRLPSGYTEPSVTVSSGVTTFADQPDVVAFCLLDAVAGETAPVQARFIVIKPFIVLYGGDSIVMQTVCNTSSVGQIYSAMMFAQAGFTV